MHTVPVPCYPGTGWCSNRDECVEQHKRQREGEREKAMSKASGIMPGVFLIFGEGLHYGPEEPKKNAPGATAQGMSELDSLLLRVHRNSVDA
jgi:hypothetical protein